MSALRGVDHVAIVVRSMETALAYFVDRLGLPVVNDVTYEHPPARMVFVDCGNVRLQLMQPTGPSPLRAALDENGEGMHHLAFAVDDAEASAAALAEPGTEPPEVTRGVQRSAFVSRTPRFGVLVECTEPEGA